MPDRKGEIMDNSLKGLLLAAGVIITCVVVGLGFYISREAKNISASGASQITSMNSEYQDVAKTMYDGLIISGREVLAVLEKFRGELEDGTFLVTVHTGKTQGSDAGGIEYGGDDENDMDSAIAGAMDKSDDAYVNPNAKFLGEITYDDNDVINGLVFTQQ